MSKRVWSFVFGVLLILDLAYSFNQHFHCAIDGDADAVILGFEELRNDPFGFDVLFNHKTHNAPNRYFAHTSMAEYFQSMPFLLQKITDPINSLYLAAAIAKIIIQILLIYLLSVFVSRKRNVFTFDFLLSAIIITPLFQASASGYALSMGIIDRAITYDFFYAFPMALLVIFAFPFFNLLLRKKPLEFTLFKRVLFSLLALVLAFNGPIIPGAILVLFMMMFLVLLFSSFKDLESYSFPQKVMASIKKIPTDFLYFMILSSLLCLYSIFIGSSNGENFGDFVIPISERYSRLFLGMYETFVKESGFVYVFGMILFNLILLFTLKLDKERKETLNLLFFMLAFSVIYICLLPLGGYRVYRPNIIRYDTIMPITLGFFMVYGLSTFALIKGLKSWVRGDYVAIFLGLSLFFTFMDRPINENKFERRALEKLSKSNQQIVRLTSDEITLSWGLIENAQASMQKAKFLKFVGITSALRLFYNEVNPISVGMDYETMEKVNIRAVDGNFVCADFGTNGNLIGNRPEAKEWETFYLIRLKNNQVLLKTIKDRYVVVDPAKSDSIFTDGESITDQSLFQMERLGKDTFALKAFNGNYFTADSTKSGQLFANAKKIGNRQKFVLILK